MKNKSISSNLIIEAKKVAKYRDLTRDIGVGRVACALQTRSGKIYTGISVSSSVNLGWCAEISVFTQMINEGETEIEMLIGMSDDGKIIPPCGRCREFMYELSRSNLNTKIIFSEDKIKTLDELLPERWQEHWSGRE